MEQIDWEKVSAELDERGSAVVERLLMPAQCRALAQLYEKEDLFRSRVVMARHGFGCVIKTEKPVSLTPDSSSIP
jgi:uncharacterized protein